VDLRLAYLPNTVSKECRTTQWYILQVRQYYFLIEFYVVRDKQSITSVTTRDSKCSMGRVIYLLVTRKCLGTQLEVSAMELKYFLYYFTINTELRRFLKTVYKRVCVSFSKAELTSVHNSEEEQFVESFIRESTDSRSAIYWLGGTWNDKSWYWVDNSTDTFSGLSNVMYVLGIF